MTLRVLDPTFEEAAKAAKIVGRLSTIAGSTIGLLDNGKINVSRILDYAEEILKGQYRVKNVIRFRKPDASRPAPESVFEAAKECDALISAVGD